MHKIILPEDKPALLRLLTCEAEEETTLFHSAAEIRNRTLGNFVYLRGLLELSNLCRKNCLYCGIRQSNTLIQRYELTDEEIIEAALYAYDHRYGSLVLQGGERTDRTFIKRIERLLRLINQKTNNGLGITLSLGEQTDDTYRRWFESGAHRYLLRIESSDPALYSKIHPQNALHSFENRLHCLRQLQKCGYKTGSGVMIGLPFQTPENLVNDLLFFRSMHIDMVGMGPYLEHSATPLYTQREQLLPLSERLRLSIHMIACLRLLMPDINIAATTALQSIDPWGREKAICAGANVIMPNISPSSNRKNYQLYQNKPVEEERNLQLLDARIRQCGCKIAFGQWGDLHSSSMQQESSNEKVQKRPK